ncbi:ParB N-terminal domain-containing protein [[Ruminococcus] lactaris]|uniref:ParB N-terminal domain-containing protein n=1 Tax=[Ruminococcus] lactaris TaxID=46228 RepID=UPI0032C1C6ED
MKVGWKKSRISAVCLEMEIQDIIIEEKDTIMYNIKKGVEQRMQDNINTLNKELVDAKISLDEIYLDPNNPRFTSLKWDDIPDQQISDASIQVATKRKLEEEFSIYKLVDNIQINGFLPIDRVIVKKFAENKYVVLEGNRRICAAKNIMELYKGNPEQVEESVVDSLKEISCLIYTGSERQPSWVFQGLRHIIGIQEWPAYNKARLLVQYSGSVVKTKI